MALPCAYPRVLLDAAAAVAYRCEVGLFATGSGGCLVLRTFSAGAPRDLWAAVTGTAVRRGAAFADRARTEAAFLEIRVEGTFLLVGANFFATGTASPK